MSGLSDAEGEYLVRLARAVIEHRLGLRGPPEPGYRARFPEKRGVFVTLSQYPTGGLRGCIGLPYPVEPLGEAVVKMALEAAFGDPRFPPVEPQEMDRLLVEVSVLTLPTPVEASSPDQLPEAVQVGRDGLIVSRGWNRGLLLPQVAVEWGWDSRQFLSQCCLKAGLPPDAWRRGGVEVYRFQAQVFGEEEPRGRVVGKGGG